LNLHGSYPASTSTQLKASEGDSGTRKSPIAGRLDRTTAHRSAPPRVQSGEVPQQELDWDHERIRVEAIEILDTARRGETIQLERARGFAAGVIALTTTGKLALEVLNGGAFTSSRLVALAADILASTSHSNLARAEKKR